MGRIEIAAGLPHSNQDWKRLLPGLLVSVLALAVVFSLIDLDDFLQAVRQADWRYLLVGGFITLPWLFVRAFVWRTLLQEKAAYRDVFLTLNEGYLLNNILPFRLGEVGRAFLLGGKSSLAFWQVIPTILIERAIDLIIAVGLFLSTLPFVVGVDWAQQAALGTGLIVGFGLVLLYIMAHNRPRVLNLVEKAGRRWPLVQRLSGERVSAFFEGLSILTSLRRFLIALTWMLFNWLLGVLQYDLLLRAFFPHAQPLWAAFALGAGALGLAAPSSPGGIGVYEATMVGALAVFDPNLSAAAAFAVSAHIFNYAITGLIGGFALAADGQTLSSMYRRLRSGNS
ncbi:MAG: flippase-like domain-containing protein [Anaerolineales bacterium]|nr:flippase-like domain-containing protein [Anaerolineales bacterium]